MSVDDAVADGSTPDARLSWLRHRLADSGAVTITEAAAALGSSTMTIRRDLATLEALGEARRVRGGAQAIGPSPFRSRSPRNARAKIAIAEKLLPMVPGTGAIAIDSSSTMACLANRMLSAQDLLVVTNGLEVFDVLQDRPGIRVIVTGGERDPRTSSLVGPTAATSAASFRYDLAFVSAAGVDVAHGALEATPEEAAIVQAFARASRRVVVGVDSSKVGTSAPVVGLEWRDIDLVVTELSPTHDRVAALTEVVTLT